ncbi:MAG: cell division protein SepF [Eggerthellaceae bacterium]|jgi:FtsZ-interacting cell division protein YlmF
MQLPRRGRSRRDDEYRDNAGGGAFSNIKSRLGFSRDDGFDDDSDEFDDYDEFYEYGEGYEEDYQDYDESYESDNRSSRQSRRSRRDHDHGFPQLVTRDEVRASTRYPEMHERERGGKPEQPYRLHGVSPREAQATYEAERAMRDSSHFGDTASMDLPMANSSSSQSGVNALFTQTDASAETVPPRKPQTNLGRVHETPVLDTRTESPDRRLRSDASSFDPYDMYEGSSSSVHSPTRALSVIRPLRYEDVERVAKILKGGDAVVIVLNETPQDLAKRILDFSFGVASALDASVECPQEKVFAITCHHSLSESERRALKNKGVLS